MSATDPDRNAADGPAPHADDLGQVFRTERLVEFADTDMAGIMHFSAFFRYMEAAEHALLRSVGLSVHGKIGNPGEAIPLSFPRVNANCDFRSPARCEDLLEIAVQISRLGSRSITYAFVFTRDQTLLAEGKMTSVCCEMHDHAPPTSVAIPDEVLQKLRPFVAQ